MKPYWQYIKVPIEVVLIVLENIFKENQTVKRLIINILIREMWKSCV